VRLSISIVNWNTTQLLRALLESIRRNAPPFDYEIIVVDNASADFDAQQFASEFPDVRLIANTGNLGYARANNQALAVSKGEYVLLLNPDTEATENAIRNLVEFAVSHPDTAAVGGKLIRPGGSVDRSVRSFPYPGPIAWEFLGLSKLFQRSSTFGAYRMTWFGYDKPAEVDQPMGSCLLITRHAIEQIGMLDEDFPIFFNEVDWLYRAKQAGYAIWFTAEAVFVHHGAASTIQVNKRRMRRESHDSLLLFYRKHFRGRLPWVTYIFTVLCIKLSRAIRG
jgi:GT2 family glycosyltransferase